MSLPDFSPAGGSMAAMPTHLSRGQRRALVFAVLVVVAGMAMGFWSSFLTLYDAAQKQGWAYPARLPLSVDSGTVAYVILDHLAVTLGARSRWLHLVALGLAAFTVWANATLGAATGVWRVVDAAMPALWVLGVEALRFLWKRMHEIPGARADRIPGGRWLAAPVATAAMRRRMWLTAETSYRRAVALEEARLHARDLILAAGEADPVPVIPGALRRAVRSGRLPAAVVAAVDTGLSYGGPSQWEPAVATWVTSSLTLSERVSAGLQSARRAITAEAAQAPEAPHETPSQAPSRDRHESRPRAVSRDSTKRRPKPSPRRMSDDDLMPYVRDALAVNREASIADIRRVTGTGPDRAKTLRQRGQRELPTPIHAARG